MNLQTASNQIQSYIQAFNDSFMYRENEIMILVVSLIIGKNACFIGSHGEAKSALIEQFAKGIDKKFFGCQFNRFSTPDEILGHFSLKEMTASQTAERKGINNNPNDDQITALQKLCENILQPVRDHYATPVTVSSGFRSPDLCVAIGSSTNSQHAKGQAADFEIFGTPNAELAKWIAENLDFDQLILEYHNPEEPNSGWIHCSYKSPTDNRKQTLRAFRNDQGKTQYVEYNPS